MPWGNTMSHCQLCFIPFLNSLRSVDRHPDSLMPLPLKLNYFCFVTIFAPSVEWGHASASYQAQHSTLAVGIDEVTVFIITSKYLYLFLDIYNLNVSIYADV